MPALKPTRRVLSPYERGATMPVLIRGGARRLVYRPDAIGAGVLAAEEALRQAGVGAAEEPHELNVEGADRAVALRHLGEGTCVLVDEVIAAGLSVVDEAALLLHDPCGFAHSFRERPALQLLNVGRGQAGGDF